MGFRVVCHSRFKEYNTKANTSCCNWFGYTFSTMVINWNGTCHNTSLLKAWNKYTEDKSTLISFPMAPLLKVSIFETVSYRIDVYSKLF